MNTSAPSDQQNKGLPSLKSVGLSGVLVTFSNELSESANRAALAFRDALERARPDGVLETSTSLTSTFLQYDPTNVPLTQLKEQLTSMLNQKDWYQAPLPENRRLWTIPAAFGGEQGPQLEEAAEIAGLPLQQAIDEIAETRTRVMTVGFAPGQPYLGTLPEKWDIPRQSGLTLQVPAGAVVVAIRQLVIFTAPTPTGWRHIAQTAFRGFRAENEHPFAFQPGDEVQFTPVSAASLTKLMDDASNGGASFETIT